MSDSVKGKVLIVGVGGLGIPAALRLAQAGIGPLTLIDPEQIELSNLARQVIYRTSDVGAPKAYTAARRLRERFPDIEAHPIIGTLRAENVHQIVASHDFIIDGTDDPVAKFLINDTCVDTRRPFVYGGVLGWFGQAMTVLPGTTACLRCLFEGPPPEAEIATCRDAGILGPVAGIIGTLQAEEAALFLRGEQGVLRGRILTYDARAGRTRITNITPRQGCRCGAFEHMAHGGINPGISPRPVTEGKI
jgi:molybdopterin/thiamine biosynthesis adenylyltransferase